MARSQKSYDRCWSCYYCTYYSSILVTMLEVKKCDQCDRLAEENSNLEILIRHLKADKFRAIKARQEAEGDLTIIKGIGQNSPEVKALKKEIKQLKKDAAEMYKYP